MRVARSYFCALITISTAAPVLFCISSETYLCGKPSVTRTATDSAVASIGWIWCKIYMTSLTINDTPYVVEIEPETPLLWVLRDTLQLTGTKYGCGAGLCGACTVHIDGMVERSCQVPIGDLDGTVVTTIEGIGSPEALTVLQQEWVAGQVAQCGYCQSGQIMQATALLRENAQPTDDDIDAAMSGNLCRCGTYPRLRAAIHAAAKRMGE